MNQIQKNGYGFLKENYKFLIKITAVRIKKQATNFIGYILTIIILLYQLCLGKQENILQ